MKLHIVTAALACATVIGTTAFAQAQVPRYWNYGHRDYYDSYRGYANDYDRWASRHDPIPANRSGAGNFGNLSPPLGGVGRVNSHTQD
jgi:hypothetical protein